MSRKDAYAYIKAHSDLAEKIKSEVGKNYTNCGTDVLVDYVNKHKTPKKVEKKNPIQIAPTEVKAETASPTEAYSNNLGRLVEVLYKKKFLIQSEVDYILG